LLIDISAFPTFSNMKIIKKAPSGKRLLFEVD